MIFNSVTFLIFLAVATVLYWVLPRKPRLWVIFLLSMLFYGFWRFEFVPLMLISSTTDYLVARSISRTKDQRRKRLLLFVSLFVNLGLLFVFKYLMFFTENLWAGLALIGFETTPPVLNIILPLGISFYTFQTISYTVDVYRGFIEPEEDYVLYSCYVMYFPQLVAGPILRAKEVITQLDVRPDFCWENLSTGLRRILFGLFLKVVLADNIASIVDAGFSYPVDTLSALDVWTLAFMFGFQIYFDFSAYSHIAIGSARLMGIHFPENFNFPYLASSPRQFWRYWHISLSSWIRDYLYLPLAGTPVHDRSTGGLSEAVPERQSPPRETRALFLTWAIMGMWHGAAWTFVVWGLWHAVLIYAYRLLQPIRSRLPHIVKAITGWPITLLLVMLSWIPFRARGLPETVEMLSKTIDLSAYRTLGLRENTYLVAALMLVSIILAYLVREFYEKLVHSRPLIRLPLEVAVLTVAIGLVFIFLRPIQQFIYFQF
ncbi:MAG: MBOAT family protein [Planctomycetes bacterium]|nr:MBOAT family protein [Planctomycetota bacterium]